MEIPAISDAEWEVMNVIWAAPAAVTAADVVAPLCGPNGWSPRTVKTLLNRLVVKGALTFETQGKRYLYRAAVPRARCVRQESKSFVSRVFGGAAGPMLVNFVEQTDLSDAEIEELHEVLARKRARRRERKS
jgi:BlaI family penicillinase repressor